MTTTTMELDSNDEARPRLGTKALLIGAPLLMEVGRVLLVPIDTRIGATAKNVLQRRSAKAMEGTGFVRRYFTLAAAIAVGAAAYLVPGSLALAAVQVAAPGGDTTVEVQAFTLGPDSSGAATATCPAGRRVVGGGVDTTGPVTAGYDYAIELSGPQDETALTANTEDGDVARHWYASILNRSGSQQDFKVFALCSQDSDATVEVQPFTLAPISSGAATATCPAGKRVVGGGVNTTGPVFTGPGADYWVKLSGPQDETALTANTEDGDVARHWYASIYNYLGSQQEFKVFALCSQDSDATVEVQPFTVPHGSSGAATATCPPGKRVVGGGVNTTGPVTTGSDYTVELSGPQDETALTANTEDGDVARHWYASIRNFSGSQQDFKVLALCASDAAPGGGPGGGGALGPTCGGKVATIVGTPGADTLSGTSNPDVIVGLGGNDVLKGLGGKDRICGGPGKDKIGGGAGADLLNGGPGGDRINGGPGKDRCNGGPGVDKVSNC